MKRLVAVTGAGGYVGAVTTQHLLECGYAVRALDAFFWDRSVLDSVADRIDIVRVDIRQIEPRHLDGAWAVIHLAGLSNDPMADYNPEANWSINADGTRRVAEAARAAGVERLTFGSSASLYDGLDPQRTHDESAQVAPSGPYSTSKYEGERILLQAAGASFCPVILRQGTVYGYSPRMRFDLVVNTFVRTALLTGELTVHGEGTNWRPLIDVSDVALAHIACLAAPNEAVCGESFNVLHDNYQIHDLAVAVQAAMLAFGQDVAIRSIDPPSHLRDYRCSAAKIADVLGFQARVTVQDSVATMLGAIGHRDPSELLHPRYQNIEWMTILDGVAKQIADLGRLF